MPNAIIGWDRMRILTTRQTLLTGDVKTVAALNVMEIASFYMLNRRAELLVPLSPFTALLYDPIKNQKTATCRNS